MQRSLAVQPGELGLSYISTKQLCLGVWTGQGYIFNDYEEGSLTTILEAVEEEIRLRRVQKRKLEVETENQWIQCEEWSVGEDGEVHCQKSYAPF